jgi:hypothetical protein
VAATTASLLAILPRDNISQRMMVASGGNRPTLRTVCREMYSEGGGVRAFYRGYWLTLAIQTPSAAAFWYTYRRLQDLCQRRASAGASVFPCAVVAGALVGAGHAPAEKLRVRYQLRAKGAGQTVLLPLTLRELYGGWRSSMLRGAVSYATIACLYELVRFGARRT